MHAVRQKGAWSPITALPNNLFTPDQREAEDVPRWRRPSPQASPVTTCASTENTAAQQDSEYTPQLTKADLDASLSAIYDKLANKFQSELNKTTSTLKQKIASLGGSTDILETKHDELFLAHNDLRKDFELVADNYSYLQTQVEDLDNRNHRNNLRLCGIPESVTEVMPAASKLFQSLLPDTPPSSFVCDRIHRALHPKPPPDKPPRDIILCMKDFITKENTLRASRNSHNIELNGAKIQIFPNISQATLERRRKMKEIMSILQSAHIRYRWGFPFKLTVLHNGTTYTVLNVTEGKDLLVKLGLLDPEQNPRPPSMPHSSPLWATPSSRRDQRRERLSLRNAFS